MMALNIKENGKAKIALSRLNFRLVTHNNNYSKTFVDFMELYNVIRKLSLQLPCIVKPNEGIQQYRVLVNETLQRQAELPLICVTSIHSSPILAISSVPVNTR